MITPATRSAGIEVICEGGPKEMGVAQGKMAKRRIQAARQQLAELEAFRLRQPRGLPFLLYRWLAENKAARLLAGPLARDYPEMSERLAGIAEGAGQRPAALLLFHALEPLLSSVEGYTACPAACSAVAVRGSRTATGEPLVARNFDYLPLVQPFYLVRESRPRGKRRAFEFTICPLAGAVDGMNDAGLCVVYNYGFTTDQPKAVSAPISMAISETLACCGSVTEAADWIASRPRWGGGLLLLCDASGDIASLELSSTRSHLRRPAVGEDVLFQTNAFASAVMVEVQIPWEAVYTDNAPSPLRGKRLHQSSELRDQRFRELLAGTGTLDADDLAAIMADHGPTGTPSDCTPCMHSDYWYTTACLQFFPRSRRMRVAYDAACRASFSELQL